MSTGGYNVLFRQGGQADTYLEIVLRSLAEGRGSAIVSEPGTVAWVEDMAIARCILEAAETIRRFQMQFNPLTMTAFLERWESILKITPPAEATHNERRRAVDAKFKMIGIYATTGAAQDFLEQIIGDMFVEIIRVPSSEAFTTYPGGLTIPGGITIPSGDWFSNVSNMPIRVSQPPYMTNAEFFGTVGNFKPFFYDFLPSYVTFDWGTYSTQDGTVDVTAGSTTMTGDGTNFLTAAGGAVEPGEKIEVRDIEGTLITFTVASVTSDTELEVTVAPTVDVADSYWARFGFYLDTTNNLDVAFLD